MLPNKIEALLREQVDIDLRLQGFRPPAFDQRALAKSFGGEVIQPAKFALALSDEISLLSTTVTEAMKKVLQKIQVPPYDSLVVDLLQLYDEEFKPCLNAIEKFGVDNLARISPASAGSAPRWFGEKASLARDVGQMEIKLVAAELGERSSQRGTVTVTIQNSQVGVVQTGDQANVIGSTISFTAEQKQELTVALNELTQKLETVESIAPATRAELREIAVEVQKELAKEKPNHARIGGLLAMIAAGIKGIAELAATYELLQHILKLFGIHLG